MSDNRIRIWRCSKCQKWSHAKVEPRKHQRWVKPGDDAYDPALNENDYADVPDGHYVECGPFDAWIAENDWNYNRYYRRRR